MTRRPSSLRRGLWSDFLLFTAAALALGAGVFVFWSQRSERVVHEAQAGSFWLRVEAADWVRDGMLHPGTSPFGMPPSMMAGLPKQDMQRLNVEFSVHNRGADTQVFDLAELKLTAESGVVWEATPGEEASKVTLRAGQRYAAVVQFDVPETERTRLTLWWGRAEAPVRMLAVVAPRHVKPEVKPPTDWPSTVDALAPGRADSGRLLYQTKFACASCHGDPALPGSNTVGPPLDGFAAIAGARVPNQSAKEYAYRSILAPNAFIAPTCARGEPCASPSAMPVYSELMSPQDMSDVLEFLLNQPLAQRQ